MVISKWIPPHFLLVAFFDRKDKTTETTHRGTPVGCRLEKRISVTVYMCEGLCQAASSTSYFSVVFRVVRSQETSFRHQDAYYNWKVSCNIHKHRPALEKSIFWHFFKRWWTCFIQWNSSWRIKRHWCPVFVRLKSSGWVETSASRLSWGQRWGSGAAGHTWHSSTKVCSHTHAKTWAHTHTHTHTHTRRWRHLQGTRLPFIKVAVQLLLWLLLFIYYWDDF